MSAELRELLPLYALGILAADEVAQVDRAIAADPALAAELAGLQDTAAQMIVLPPPAEPSEEVKLRLMAAIGGGRFDAFAGRLGQLFDVSLDRAREILSLAERKASWVQPIPGLGIELIDFQGGPKYAGADCGFVRMAPGRVFPPHLHLGTEYTLVLAGTLVDRTLGRRLGPGDEMVHDAGASHHDIASETDEVVFVTLAVDGIQLMGMTGRAKY